MSISLDDGLNMLIKNWLYNLINRKINESILLLIYPGKLENLVNFDSTTRQYLQVQYLSKYLKYVNMNNTNINHILIIDPTQNIQLDLEKINIKLLIVPSEHNFFKKTEEYTTVQSYLEIDINENEQYQFYLKKENTVELIQNTNVQYLYDLIQKKLWMLKKIYNAINQIITQGISMENFPNDNLRDDITMLCEYKILTSRLAVILYRVASLEINANITKIGRNVHLTTGSKSKSFTLKMIASLLNVNRFTISHDLLRKKTFKAYNLNVNDAEVAIRMEIANELLSFDLNELTPNLISEATKLPIEIINKLNSKFN